MKFVHTSDWHISDKHRYSVNGSRFMELLSNIREIVKGAIDSQANFIVIAGDIFHNHNPSERLLREFVALISGAIKSGIKVRVVLGQHDTNGVDHSLQSLSAYSSQFKDHDCFKVYPGGQVFKEKCVDDGVVFWYVSWSKDMHEIISKIKPLSPYVNILVSHTGVLGVRAPSGHMKRRGYMGADQFQLFDYVAMGDFHNCQQIADNIHYCGSPIKFRWDERDNLVGYNVVDIVNNKVNVSRVGLSDIEMIDCNINVDEIEGDLYEIDGKKVADSFLRITLFGSITDEKRVKLITSLYEAGARDVKLICNSNEQVPVNNMIENLSIIDMIKNQNLEDSIEKYGIEIASRL